MFLISFKDGNLGLVSGGQHLIGFEPPRLGQFDNGLVGNTEESGYLASGHKTSFAN